MGIKKHSVSFDEEKHSPASRKDWDYLNYYDIDVEDLARQPLIHRNSKKQKKKKISQTQRLIEWLEMMISCTRREKSLYERDPKARRNLILINRRLKDINRDLETLEKTLSWVNKNFQEQFK